jgi:hypothetical protein
VPTIATRIVLLLTPTAGLADHRAKHRTDISITQLAGKLYEIMAGPIISNDPPILPVSIIPNRQPRSRAPAGSAHGARPWTLGNRDDGRDGYNAEQGKIKARRGGGGNKAPRKLVATGDLPSSLRPHRLHALRPSRRLPKLAAGRPPELTPSKLSQDLDLKRELHSPTPKRRILGFQMSQQLMIGMALSIGSRPRPGGRELNHRSGFLAVR